MVNTVFKGNESQFPMWFRRLTSATRGKGLLFSMAIKQAGGFKGLSHDTKKASDGIAVDHEALRSANVTGIDTPLAKSLGISSNRRCAAASRGARKVNANELEDWRRRQRGSQSCKFVKARGAC